MIAVLVNIRGTHGAGKSTAIRALMERGMFRHIIGTTFGLRCPEAYVGALPGVEQNVFVLGPYITACGGCDAIQPFELILTLLDKYAARGHVVFEGILISTCWGAVGQALERRGRDAAVLFLDTPFRTCIDRVRVRRRAGGDLRPFDPTRLKQKHARIASLRAKIEAGSVRVLTASSENAAATIIGLLQRSGGKQ